MQNKYCEDNVLTNEASVESFFVNRMLNDMGYEDASIMPKTSIQALTVAQGSRNLLYKPDYALKVNGNIKWILDAKAPNENIDNYIGQCSGYCLMLNQTYRNENPVEFFVLTNGYKTKIFNWDSNEPIMELEFEDFQIGNEKFEDFKNILSYSSIETQETVESINQENTHIMYKLPLEEINAAFAWCHQHIYKKDAMSQSAAFEEFVKVVFLKLLSDRRILRSYPQLASGDVIHVPKNEVKFRKEWIIEREEDTPNPLATIQFSELLNQLEREISEGNKRRIFDADETINLSPETIKGVVEKLEGIFLFGIDADLNGRLFETFLNATMRGKDLGQFFTPRSVVKLGAKLANVKVGFLKEDGTRYTESVLDACSGTGGFLIETLGDMWRKVDRNNSLSIEEKQNMKREIALNKIYGIDVGKEPALARIARMNMYLHGDGGSSIYQADALDKEVRVNANDSIEMESEKNELRRLVTNPDGFVDVVITNPPFAKTYDRRTETESRILDSYRIGRNNGVLRQSLKSSLMFFERYHDLLKDGGRMITVIDDGILGGRDYAWFRNEIRDMFIIKAVISLPGDAFQRSKARVKTSIIILEKKDPDAGEQQSSVFMYPCRYVGIDDPARQRVLPIDRENRIKADEEIETVNRLYTSFLNGDSSVSDFVVPAEKIQDRIDVKSCLYEPNRNVDEWIANHYNVVNFADLVELVEFDERNTIVTRDSTEVVTYVRVRYDGYAEAGDTILASDSKYSKLYLVHEDDIVISNIGATYGATAIIPSELDGAVVTSEYTVLRPLENVSKYLVWLLLRSPEARANLLLSATGISRTRVKWENLANLIIPIPNIDVINNAIYYLSEAEEMLREVELKRRQARETFESAVDINNQVAKDILSAFKPPN
ncbi:N-6 DNA methylase [Gracilibacillus sp. Marseille-QA3620]